MMGATSGDLYNKRKAKKKIRESKGRGGAPAYLSHFPLLAGLSSIQRIASW